MPAARRRCLLLARARAARLAAAVLLWALTAPGAVLAQDAGASASPSPGLDFVAVLQRGRAAADAGDLDAAQRQLAEAAQSPDARVAGQAQFYLGEVLERALRFRPALAAYRASIARDPGGRYASRAMARIEFLEARAEGEFAPLAALERVRSSPARASDPAAIAELARLARGFPPGLVRAEARLLAAQAYAGRLGRPADAAPILLALARDPAATPAMHQLALELLVQVRERTGQPELGLAELRALGGDPALQARLAQRVRRNKGCTLALGVSALVLLAGAVAVVRALLARRARALLRAWLRPLPLAHIALFSVGGALLAHTYDEHDMSPFFGLGAGALLVYLAASAWSLVGSGHPAARGARALACALAMLAVSFLAMYRFDQGMLEGIGL